MTPVWHRFVDGKAAFPVSSLSDHQRVVLDRNMKIQGAAFLSLQELAKIYLMCLFEDVNLCAIHAK